MTDRRPGRGRYARVEREQRWTLVGVPADAKPSAEILDRYIVGTTLRLRRIEGDGSVVYKLCQKVRDDPADPENVRLTNVYITEAEYATLSVLPAGEISKTRWTLGRFAVDEFHGALDGLVLAELELSPDGALLPLPSFAVADVTHDDRYSGGALSRVDASDAGALIPRPEPAEPA